MFLYLIILYVFRRFHREGRVQGTLLAGQYQYQSLTGNIQNAADAAADDAAVQFTISQSTTSSC